MAKKTAKTVDFDEVFDGLDEADAAGRLPKLKTGQYTGLRIDKTLFKADGFKAGQSFIIEMTLVGESDTVHNAGTRLSATINGFDNNERRDLALGNLKSFLGAAYAVDPSSKQQWGKLAKKVCELNALAGKFVDAQAEVIETKKGFEFVKIIWEASEFTGETAGDDSDEAAE